MLRRRLGASDLEVSEIGLGSWLTHAGQVGRERAEDCTRAAFEAGITFFDTANSYGEGAAEEAWGEILGPYRRDSYVLATKVFFPMNEADRGLSRAQIEKQLDASLARLRTDYLDLYQCHRFDPLTPIEETMEALTRAVESGKVRQIGFSEWTPAQIRAGLDVVDTVRPISSQPQYSMLWRVPESEVFELCRRHGIGNVVWSPLAEGALTGKYRPGRPPPAGSRAATPAVGNAPGAFIHDWLRGDVMRAVERLGRIAAEAGLTMVQLALAWVLRRPEVSSAIVGATTPAQVLANASASGVVLDAETLDAIDAALDGVAVEGFRLAPGAEPGVARRGEPSP